MLYFLGILCAILLHTGFILFGGLLFPGARKDGATLAEVELLSELEAEQKEEEELDEPEEREVLETEPEEMPEVAEVMSQQDLAPEASAPELDAASLSAIEAALDGSGGGGGDFASSFDFSSGGRLDGKGKAGQLGQELDGAFSLAEIDQKPTAVFQTAPLYPSEMRGKKVEGLVTMIFVVDAAGKVSNPRVEKSSHSAFEKPALDAVRQWKFEPGVKAGKRVACKLRVPIRFQQS
jgi:periplasmic protein TonB